MLLLLCCRYTDIHTHKCEIIHPQTSTNTLVTLLHPACLEWQGQKISNDNMAAVISSPQSLSPERHEAEAVSREEVTHVWRGALLSNQTTAGAWQRYLPGLQGSFLLTDNTGGRRHDQETHHLHVKVDAERRVREMMKPGNRDKIYDVFMLQEKADNRMQGSSDSRKKMGKNSVSVCPFACHTFQTCLCVSLDMHVSSSAFLISELSFHDANHPHTVS